MIVTIIAVLTGLVILVSSVKYVISFRKDESSDELNYIYTHADEFRVKNNGVSLDNREIYKYTAEELGLKQ